MEDYYHILRIQPTATSREIKKAYRKRSRKLHPDRHPEKDTTAKLQRVERAWEILGDPERKREYDTAKEGERGANQEEAAPEMNSKKRKHREEERGEIEIEATLETKSKKRKHHESETGELEIQKTGKRAKIDASRVWEERKRNQETKEARQREFDKKEAKRIDAEAKAAWKA